MFSVARALQEILRRSGRKHKYWSVKDTENGEYNYLFESDQSSTKQCTE